MTDIDFLPADFRRHGAHRRDPLWRIAVVVGFGLLLSGTALAQHHRWRQACDALAATEQVREQTRGEADELGRLRAEVAAAEEQARLLAYLHHPWPRTRILATLLNPLPDEITLEKLTISQAAPPGEAAVASSVLVDPKAEEARLATMDPAARDLEDLRRIADTRQTVVSLSGTTNRPEVLHAYLSQLGRGPLVAKVELDSIEVAEKDRVPGEASAEDSPMEFSATVVLRPGYGQPGGPAGRAPAASHAHEPSPVAPAPRPS